MPIRYYEGVEGAGKSAMLTRDLYMHYLAGGKVLTFPGYEIYGEGKNDIISDILMPEDWVTLPDSLKKNKVAIGIDEVTNFFNNHVWYNKICDMMAGLMAERRKFEIAILMTGPIFRRLPPNIQEMVHELIHCQDNHCINHAIPRGEKCIYYKEDLRGLLSNPKRRFTRKRIFYTKPWWKHFNTYQAVDLIHQFIKVKFKAREIIVGADGKLLNNTDNDLSSDPATLDRYIANYKEMQSGRYRPAVIQFLKDLIDNGVVKVPKRVVWDYFKVNSQSDKAAIGSIILGAGARTLTKHNEYDLRWVAREVLVE